MANFQQALLDELKQYQTELAGQPTPDHAPPKRGRSRLRWVGAGVGVAAAAVAMIVALPSGSNGPTARGVTVNDDGTVTIRDGELSDLDAVARVLNEAGIPTEIHTDDCGPDAYLGIEEGEEDVKHPFPPGFRTARNDASAVYNPSFMPPNTVLAFVKTVVEEDGFVSGIWYGLAGPNELHCIPRQ